MKFFVITIGLVNATSRVSLVVLSWFFVTFCSKHMFKLVALMFLPFSALCKSCIVWAYDNGSQMLLHDFFPVLKRSGWLMSS
uniref:Uncharacterized protein n=1 Tax=Arundo donax TaxID=35708 RepID=A0A0A9AVB5_ARUDO